MVVHIITEWPYRGKVWEAVLAKWAGLGGWYDMGDGVETSRVAWFQLTVTPGDFPHSWKLRPEPQRDISFYELLSQACLLFARTRQQSLPNAIVNLRQDCDNMTSVCVGNKMFSTARPMKFAAQLLASISIQHGSVLDVQHVPGQENDLADRLSRQRKPNEIGLCPTRQQHINIPMLLQTMFG